MSMPEYLMESDEEALRLDLKTDVAVVARQARWAGLAPGMRVIDVGCGSGKTTAALHELAGPQGRVVGLDLAPQRVDFARAHYGAPGREFLCRDAREPLDDLGRFDLVWARFLLEYYRAGAFDLVENIYRLVRPGGVLCLIDLDYNCLSHFGLSPKMERTIFQVMRTLEEKADFDPYAGRKLYSFLYDLGCREIDVAMDPHHLFFGELAERDAFNWEKKLEVAVRRIGAPLPEYGGDCEAFFAEFRAFFSDPRRFTYTPVISCRGRKPGS